MRRINHGTLVPDALLAKLASYSTSKLNQDLLNEFDWLGEVYITTSAEQPACNITFLITRKDKAESCFSGMSKVKTFISENVVINKEDVNVEDYDLVNSAVNSPSIATQAEMHKPLLLCRIPLEEFNCKTQAELNRKLDENYTANLGADHKPAEDVPGLGSTQTKSDKENLEFVTQQLALALAALPSHERKKRQQDLEAYGMSLPDPVSVEIL
ncbi:MAG: hypothetical protein HON23_02315 [Rickettsiales bacterium]|jgi:hypothetical protein|nr:hypothetical protein [Rickettsiales bacterium]